MATQAAISFSALSKTVNRSPLFAGSVSMFGKTRMTWQMTEEGEEGEADVLRGGSRPSRNSDSGGHSLGMVLKVGRMSLL